MRLVRRRQRQRPPRTHPRRAFTIVEILVVVAVIGVLLAITLPALAYVSAAARSASCTSNLRQMHVATVSYSMVHNDRFPAAILYFATPGGVRTVAWDAALEPPVDGAPAAVGEGPLAPFLDGTDRIRQCPDHFGAANFGADLFSGYNYNTTYIGAEGVFPYMNEHGTLVDGWAAARPGLSGAMHRRPSDTALFADGGFSGGANRFMRAPGNSVEFNLGLLYAGTQAFRHAGGCNVVHLDGSCKSCAQPRRGIHATESLLGIAGYPENGFLSDDDSAYDPR